MHASLRALLTGLIDYAGLFPPAGLPLDQAIRNYARYQKEPESWMLARFICPAKQLEELAPFVEELFDFEHPFHFSALGLAADAIRRFREQFDTQVVADAIECHLVKDEDPLRILEGERAAALAFFFEVTPRGKWHDDIAAAIIAITGASDSREPLVGLKLRCGGLHPSVFPAPWQVALTIAACRDAKVPLKFTAGLHHPIRHFSAEVQTHMHGFINVFTAGVLAHARGLNAEQLRPIIEDEDANDFVFDDAGLRWKDHRATTEEIARARQQGVTSFGSCSFDEPRDDLRKLGWLP